MEAFSHETGTSCMGAARAWDLLPGVPSTYDLPDDEIHVWLVRIGQPPAHLRALTEILSAEERHKADRFHLPVDRERHVLGRALVRIALGRLLGREPDILRFSYNAFGKPYLSHDSREGGAKFNVSHSGELVLMALTARREVGVDVEFMRQDVEIDGIARRFFSPREQADWASLELSARREAFFSCWPRKEAFIKARGDGLSLPLDCFDVSLRPGEPARLVATRPDSSEASRWTIQALEVGRDHKAH